MMRKIDKINAAKYACIVLLVVYIIMLFLSDRNSKTSFETMKRCVENNVNLSNMKGADNRDIKRLYGLNAKEYSNILLYCTDESMGVEEIFLVKTENEEQLDSAEEAVKNRIALQKKNFDGYGTEQMKLLKESVVVRKGNVFLFVVSPDAQKCEEVFLKIL